jgi:hypothetical protein
MGPRASGLVAHVLPRAAATRTASLHDFGKGMSSAVTTTEDVQQIQNTHNVATTHDVNSSGDGSVSGMCDGLARIHKIDSEGT